MMNTFPGPESLHNPSSLRVRLSAAGLAAAGCSIATYLALYQLSILTHVWEPFFGDGSRLILKNFPIAHLLPVPDAALGAIVYFIEAVAECLGDRQRWRTWPAAVFGCGAVAAVLAVTAVALVLCQVLWFRAYCTLCLASAACSLTLAGLVAPEVWAAVKHYTGDGLKFLAHGESWTSTARRDRSERK